MSELSKIINNPILKPNRVIRYSGIYQAETEALSEHVLSVQLISYMIASDLNNLGENINLGILLEKGLLHDIDEVLTGDIPRPTKYATSQSKEMLDTIARNSLDKLPKITSRMIAMWEDAKDYSKEGFIIRLADFMDVYKKIVLEITRLGNLEFYSVAKEFLEYCNSINWGQNIKLIYTNLASQDYLINLSNEVCHNLNSIVREYRNCHNQGWTVSRV